MYFNSQFLKENDENIIKNEIKTENTDYNNFQFYPNPNLYPGFQYISKKIELKPVIINNGISPITITQIPRNDIYNNVEIMPVENLSISRNYNSDRWTVEEDSRLSDAVKKHGAKNWKYIAKLVGTKSDSQCVRRWKKVVSPELVKGPWTPEEDKIIIEEVKKSESINSVRWSEIAQKLKGRIGKQCRERYLNYLDSSIKKSDWTEEEDKVLFELQRVIGNKWSEIAKVIPGRSENGLKNRFNSRNRNIYYEKHPTSMIPDNAFELTFFPNQKPFKRKKTYSSIAKPYLKYLDLSPEFLKEIEKMELKRLKMSPEMPLNLSIQTIIPHTPTSSFYDSKVCESPKLMSPKLLSYSETQLPQNFIDNDQNQINDLEIPLPKYENDVKKRKTDCYFDSVLCPVDDYKSPRNDLNTYGSETDYFFREDDVI